MKCIVTGGAGFIGSHICDRLFADGNQLIVIDDLSTGNIKNIQHLLNKKNVVLEQIDVSDALSLQNLCKKIGKIDWIFHLAGKADIVPSIEQPSDYFETNVQGTMNVLEAAKALDCKKLVYAASSSSYGIPKLYPTPETSAISPQYPYALTKYMGEELVMHWGQVYKLPVISLRLFNVYGPRSRTTGAYGAVFGVFLAQKYNKKPYTVVGDGTQTRDFTYVTDIADAFVKAAQSDVSGELFNIGSGNHYSINYLVSLLGGKVEYIPKRPGEPDCTFADISKVKSIIGWTPKISFEVGVCRMLEHLEDWAQAPLWESQSIRKATESWFNALSNTT